MIADNIRARRAAVGLTQEQLAEQVGVSRQTVAKWEAGDTAPDLANAAVLARVLDVSLDELAFYDGASTAGLPVPPKGKHIFGTVTLGERGQVVIPKAARDVFGLQPGDLLLILGDEEQGIALTKADDFLAGVVALAEQVDKLRG